MKMLVTGGAGFIGSNFVKMAVTKHHDVVVFDSLTYAGNLEYLKSVKRKIDFCRQDIRKEIKVDGKEFDCIVNFAAESSVDVSIKSPTIFQSTNVGGTVNLLEYARKHDLDFVQISTDEVYGDTFQKFPSTESDLLIPSSPYSASKAAADMFVMAYKRTYGLKMKITRTCNNYGPHQHYEKLIPKFIGAALRDEPLTVYGKGESVREWIYVEDNCEAIFKVIYRGKNGEIYNIGTGECYNVLEVANAIIVLTKSKSKIKYVGNRPGEDKRYELDSTKIRSMWCPKYLFKDGIKKTIEWYKG